MEKDNKIILQYSNRRRLDVVFVQLTVISVLHKVLLQGAPCSFGEESLMRERSSLNDLFISWCYTNKD